MWNKRQSCQVCNGIYNQVLRHSNCSKLQPLTNEQRYNTCCCARVMDKFGDEHDANQLFPMPRPQFIQVSEYVVVDIWPPSVGTALALQRQYIPAKLHHRQRQWQQTVAEVWTSGRCGNAVPPPFAEALVRANMPELFTWPLAAQLFDIQPCSGRFLSDDKFFAI